MNCIQCGNRIEAEARFCKHCGAKIADAAFSAFTCRQCGAELDENAAFCGSCGAKTQGSRAAADREDARRATTRKSRSILVIAAGVGIAIAVAAAVIVTQQADQTAAAVSAEESAVDVAKADFYGEWMLTKYVEELGGRENGGAAEGEVYYIILSAGKPMQYGALVYDETAILEEYPYEMDTLREDLWIDGLSAAYIETAPPYGDAGSMRYHIDREGRLMECPWTNGMISGWVYIYERLPDGTVQGLIDAMKNGG